MKPTAASKHAPFQLRKAWQGNAAASCDSSGGVVSHASIPLDPPQTAWR